MTGTVSGVPVPVSPAVPPWLAALIEAGPWVILALALLGAVGVAYKVLPPLVLLYIERRKKVAVASELNNAVAAESPTSKSQRTVLTEVWIQRMEARAQEIHDAKEALQAMSLRMERAESHIRNLMGYWVDMRKSHEELRVQVADVAGDIKELKAKVEAGEDRACRIEDGVTDTNRKMDRLIERFLPTTPRG